MKKRHIAILSAVVLSLSTFAQDWIPAAPEAKPYTRWWWLGSAVDKNNLSYNLQAYAQAGIGGVEITPIYGVQGNKANNIPYLSPQWMEMLGFTEAVGRTVGIETDMATGTGWPFGGPLVPIQEAAAKAIFQTYDYNSAQPQVIDIQCQDPKQRDFALLQKVMAYRTQESDDAIVYQKVVDVTSSVKNGTLDLRFLPRGQWKVIALYCGRTRQQVKRAAPGGEGLVIDHFSKTALQHYLARFDSAFANQRIARPHTFFNDSYEVYGADWTPELLDEFSKRRGYRLENYFPDFLREENRTDAGRRIMSDYRLTLGELLLENFTEEWTRWAHNGHAITRNQAHGSPANLIDVYAAVDIPECEGFGLSDFGIKGLRQDPGNTKKNFSDISMLKYASSAAHISGKRYTSSETFTWLTEHFRTSLSQCKPDLDLMFISGVNHVFFHGTCYSPQDDPWPGWRFYASVDMSPASNYWHDMPAFSKYIERCQSFLQWGEPDNDMLVYLPYYDMIYDQEGRLAQFDIHSMDRRAPEFIKAIQTIIKSGYDVDYISDKYLARTYMKDGHLTTTGQNAYSAIIVPGVRFIDEATFAHLLHLAEQGATVVFVGGIPQQVPGFSNLEQRTKNYQSQLAKLAKNIGFIGESDVNSPYGKGRLICASDYASALSQCDARREPMRSQQGLQCLRRANSQGYHYFVANLQGKDIDEWVELGVAAEQVVIYNPMDGAIGRAKVKHEGGKTSVLLQLASGQSAILRTFTQTSADNFPDWTYFKQKVGADPLQGTDWTLTFTASAPQVPDTLIHIGSPRSWTSLGDSLLNITMATGRYSTTFELPATMTRDWLLDLGDVRESARVSINGEYVATLFAVPYCLRVGKYLCEGTNTIDIEVSNLPANRIAWMDRKGVKWRKFEEINVVDLNYKKDDYAKWSPVPSGLNSDVHLYPLEIIK